MYFIDRQKLLLGFVVKIITEVQLKTVHNTHCAFLFSNSRKVKLRHRLNQPTLSTFTPILNVLSSCFSGKQQKFEKCGILSYF